MAVCFHMSDLRLDGGAPRELAFDAAEDPAFLAGDEDAARVWGIVAAVSLVDIGTLDLAAGELFSGFDDGAQRVAVIRIAGQRPGVQNKLATWCRGGWAKRAAVCRGGLTVLSWPKRPPSMPSA